MAELKALQVRPLPCERTIERVLERNGKTIPRVRLARFLPTYVYPAPQAQRSNQLHLGDIVGPIYLKDQRSIHAGHTSLFMLRPASSSVGPIHL